MPPVPGPGLRQAEVSMTYISRQAAWLVAGLTSLPALPVYAQPYWNCAAMMHEWWWVFPLLMLAMFAVCVGIFAFACPWGRHRHRGEAGSAADRALAGDPTLTAMQILNERFAKGELQRQDYEERKSAILADSRH